MEKRQFSIDESVLSLKPNPAPHPMTCFSSTRQTFESQMSFPHTWRGKHSCLATTGYRFIVSWWMSPSVEPHTMYSCTSSPIKGNHSSSWIPHLNLSTYWGSGKSGESHRFDSVNCALNFTQPPLCFCRNHLPQFYTLWYSDRFTSSSSLSLPYAQPVMMPVLKRVSLWWNMWN